MNGKTKQKKVSIEKVKGQAMVSRWSHKQFSWNCKPQTHRRASLRPFPSCPSFPAVWGTRWFRKRQKKKTSKSTHKPNWVGCSLPLKAAFPSSDLLIHQIVPSKSIHTCSYLQREKSSSKPTKNKATPTTITTTKKKRTNGQTQGAEREGEGEKETPSKFT